MVTRLSRQSQGGAAGATTWSAARRRVAVLMVLAVAACGSLEDQVAGHYERALSHVEAGDDARAMAELRNVLRLDPKHVDARYQTGRIHERAERWPQAIAAYEGAVAEDPTLIAAHLRIGELALLADETELAERAAAGILAADPAHPDGRILDAAVMLRKGDLQRAQNAAEAVLAEHPGHANAVAVVVGVLNARGRSHDAAAALDVALETIPDSQSLLSLRIVLHEQAGEVAGARRLYERLIALEPAATATRLQLAAFLQRQGDPAGAEGVLREGLAATGGSPDIGEPLVVLVLATRGPEAAEAELDEMIATHAAVLRYRFLLAELLAAQRRDAEAEAVLLPMVDGSDRNAGREAATTRARLRLVQDDVDGARTMVEEVLAQDRDHREANVVRGLIHLIEDQPDDALRSARTALRRDPDWPPALKLLGEAHMRRGETDLAIEALRAAFAIDPRDTAAAQVLATLLTQRGDFDAALRIWDLLVAQGPDPDGAREMRARIRIDQESWGLAEADIRELLETPGREVTGATLAGTLDLGRGRYTSSRDWFGRVLEVEPDERGALMGLVRAYVADDDPGAARAFLAARTAERPDDALAHNLYGELALAAGDDRAAVTAFEQAIAVAPAWPQPYRLLAALHRDRLENADAAIQVYQSGLEALPDEPALLNELAGTLILAGRYAEAIAAYDRLVTLDPTNDLAANNYASLVADHAYDDPDALALGLERAERFRTSTIGPALDTLGWVHYRKGDHAMAVSLLERALGQLGDHPQVRYHLAMALKASGQTDRARHELERALATADPDAPWRATAEAALAALDG